jgi:lipoyl(octanoyl) transferase
MIIRDLGTMAYREAWTQQEQVHAEVVSGGEGQLLLVEHPPVITFGRRPEVSRNLVASDEQLQGLGVEVVHSDRGGDVTFHGPGQVVAYPIIRLNDHRLSVGGYVRRLELAVIAALEDLGVAARKDPCAIGVWVPREGGDPAKICALGVRIRRGVTMHGIALNVTTDLRFFDLIIPCGLSGRSVTSLATILGGRTPPMEQVKRVLVKHLAKAIGEPAATGPARTAEGAA